MTSSLCLRQGLRVGRNRDLSLAGSQVITGGRIWVTAEVTRVSLHRLFECLVSETVGTDVLSLRFIQREKILRHLFVISFRKSHCRLLELGLHA
jgi:hypothetical protein